MKRKIKRHISFFFALVILSTPVFHLSLPAIAVEQVQNEIRVIDSYPGAGESETNRFIVKYRSGKSDNGRKEVSDLFQDNLAHIKQLQKKDMDLITTSENVKAEDILAGSNHKNLQL